MKQFSPSTQAFYDSEFNYPNLPNDVIDIDDKTYQELLTKLNDGCYIKANLTASEPRPSSNHIYQDGQWVLGADKSEVQSQVWESIKTYRQAVTRGGVYLPSVDKWFHSDDASRTQYLAMQIMPTLPPNLMWKTMDGSFITMTKELLNDIALTMMTAEQSDFANAERHRAAMMQADNPLEYDYSDGWSEIYGK